MLAVANLKKGLIGTVALIIICLFILAYFAVDLRHLSQSPTFLNNWNFIKEKALFFWEKTLGPVLDFIWKNVFSQIINTIKK
jgi:ABC-type phosphate/phosphonate transport system permease subunit